MCLRLPRCFLSTSDDAIDFAPVQCARNRARAVSLRTYSEYLCAVLSMQTKALEQ